MRIVLALLRQVLICGFKLTVNYLASNEDSRGRHPQPVPIRTISAMASIPLLQSGEDGSEPSWSTKFTTGSFNGRTAVFEAAYVRSIRTPVAAV